jgi:hypothetical protein
VDDGGILAGASLKRENSRFGFINLGIPFPKPSLGLIVERYLPKTKTPVTLA